MVVLKGKDICLAKLFRRPTFRLCSICCLMLPLQTGRQHEPGEENPLQFGLILSTISTRCDDRTQANTWVDCCASVERHLLMVKADEAGSSLRPRCLTC